MDGSEGGTGKEGTKNKWPTCQEEEERFTLVREIAIHRPQNLLGKGKEFRT